MSLFVVCLSGVLTEWPELTFSRTITHISHSLLQLISVHIVFMNTTYISMSATACRSITTSFHCWLWVITIWQHKRNVLRDAIIFKKWVNLTDIRLYWKKYDLEAIKIFCWPISAVNTAEQPLRLHKITYILPAKCLSVCGIPICKRR